MTDSNVRYTTLDWQGDLRFSAGQQDGPRITVDGQNIAGPSPMIALLIAAAGCSGADVVDILRKKKVVLQRFRIEISGTRREEYPRRYTALKLTFRLAGEGLTREKAERAVELSVGKYCSVLASLDPVIPVTTEIVVENQ